MTRRKTIAGAAASAIAGCASQAVESAPATSPEGGAGEAELDAALTRLHDTDPEFNEGRSNHGPMASEALEALGHPARIESFVDFYVRRLDPFPAAEALPWERWRDGLGRPDARASLVRAFEERVASHDPAQVLAEVVPALTSGLVAAAFHGVLRLGHAWRAWSRHPSSARRRELAHGLGHWVSRYQQLPGVPGAHAEAGLGAAAALGRVPLVPAHERVSSGLITGRFGMLEGRPDFVRAVEAFDPDAQAPEAAVDAMSLASVRLYRSARSGASRFIFLHGVTGSAAVRNLLPALPADARRSATAYLFASLAAVVATHAEDGPSPDKAEIQEPDVLAEAASRSRDDHTIKFVEAAINQWRRTEQPDFLYAAAEQLRM